MHISRLMLLSLSLAMAAAQDLADIRGKLAALAPTGDPDIDVYRKAGEWIVRYPEEFFTKAYYANASKVLETGLLRAAQRDAAPWRKRTGRVVRGYKSRVDGSLQPYALAIPESYTGAKPVRLDVVLHGRGAQLNEVSFIAGHESTTPVKDGYIALEVFGRTNNAYRWSGETDVFEAIEAVRKNYNIDADRIVLRGFSMGGAGAWHIGLHHPSEWVAFEAGAGFTETKEYTKKSDYPPYVEATLHIYDAVDYALNAMNLPFVGYGGEIDPQLQGSVNIKDALAREGVTPKGLFLVGPQTAHKFHPESKKQSDAFLNAAVERGRHAPEQIRFVTYTTRYNKAFGITVDALEKHYTRAAFTASGGKIATRNVARMTIPAAAEVDGTKVKAGAIEKANGKWRAASPAKGLRKTHGLQGPIDDAFMDAFVCVRPSSGSSEILERFAGEYEKYLRGRLPVKSADQITDDDIANRNLALFGDPKTNPLIARIAARLPLKFKDGETPVLIYPNPLNPKRYVVVNSGHTMHAEDFKGSNALLYPRLGDWAVLDAAGKVLRAGIFDEQWQLR